MLNELIELEGLVRQRAVIADGGAQSAEYADHERDPENLPPRYGEKYQSEDGENMDEDEIKEDCTLAFDRLPKWAFPGALFCGLDG